MYIFFIWCVMLTLMQFISFFQASKLKASTYLCNRTLFNIHFPIQQASLIITDELFITIMGHFFYLLNNQKIY